MKDHSRKPDAPQDEPIKVVDRRWWATEAAAASASSSASSSSASATTEREAWQPDKPTFVQELERQLAEKNALLQDYITKFKETQREFDEARTRLRKDVTRDVERSRRSFLAELLEVVDNLDRALAAAASGADATALLEGVELVRRQMLSKLESFGVTRVEALGQPFDPTRHEAVTLTPAASPDQDGRIVGVIAPGYQIGDDLLRPATVAVAQYTPDAGAGRS